MGTAKQSKKRLEDLKRGTPYRDPATGKVTVETKKGKREAVILDPEAYDTPAERAARAKKKKK